MEDTDDLDLSPKDMRLLQCVLPLAREAKDMRPQFNRLTEVCEGYGLPVDVDALVRHITSNVGLAKYMDGINDQTAALQHVGWLGPLGGIYPYTDSRDIKPGRLDRPVFTHDDWLDKVPSR